MFGDDNDHYHFHHQQHLTTTTPLYFKNVDLIDNKKLLNQIYQEYIK